MVERPELGELAERRSPLGMVAGEGQEPQRSEPSVALAVGVEEEAGEERYPVVRRCRKDTQALVEERRATKMIRRWALAAR